MDCLNTKFIERKISQSLTIKQKLLEDKRILNTIYEVCMKLVSAFQNGNKVLFMGNGGSAADAQHLAAELSGRFYLDRPPLFAEALHVNTSYLTAIANDYSYDDIYARLVLAKAKKGDVLIGISTSGNSNNIIRAFEVCKNKGIAKIGITGLSGGKMKTVVDYLINVPSSDTPRIQEAHIFIGHIICEIVEAQLFKCYR